MGQKRVHKEKQKAVRKTEESQESKADRTNTDALKAEMDEMLDGIDELLVENAQEFVDQYVQKGGE